MKKYKWLILFVVFIILMVLGVTIIASINNKDLTINRKLRSTAWWNYKNTYYENDKVVDTKTEFDPPYYIIFKEDKVRYCNGKIQECKEYPYTYENKKGKVTVNITEVDYFIPKGIYEVEFGQGTITLINYSEGKKIVYELVGAIG